MLLFPFTDFCENFGVIYLLCVIEVVSYLFVSNFEREIDARPANTDLLAHAQHFTAELIDVSFYITVASILVAMLLINEPKEVYDTLRVHIKISECFISFIGMSRNSFKK